ncbi:MAG: MATE family efflux transporter [bacterium]
MTEFSAHLPKIIKEAKTTVKVGAPVVAAQIVQMSMAFTDTLMAGNLSAKALAAVAVGTSLFGPVFFFIVGVLLAVNPIVAQLFGAGKMEQIGRNIWQALWLSQILAVPCFFILRNMNIVMDFFHIKSEIIPITQGYLDAFSWGVPAAFAYFALRFVNEGISVTKPSMYFALLGLLLNVLGNYVFMYGKLGVPALGAVGTGWATTLVWWTILAAIVRFTFRKQNNRLFSIVKGLNYPVWANQNEILKIGLPNGFSIGIEVTMFATVALIMGSLGVKIIAGHQIAINFAAFTFMIPLGLSFATTARVGFAVGAEEFARARFIGYIGIAVSVLVMSLTAILMFTVPRLIVRIYTQDLEVTEIAVKLLYLAAIFQISDGLQVSSLGALRGLKDTKIPMFVNIVAYWVVGLPFGYYLGIHFDYGAQGLWIGLIAGLSVAAILHNWRFYYLTNHRARWNVLYGEIATKKQNDFNLN